MQTFKENYELVSSKSGLKAVPKSAAGFPDALTGDGEIFNPENRYYFFDESGREVRSSIGLRRIAEDALGSFGLTVCKISQLRANRDDALSDGQEFFKAEIEKLQEKIEAFEAEKAEKGDANAL